MHGKRPEQQAVDDGEDGGVGADAEGQRQYGDGRDDRRGSKRADGQAHVAPGIVEKPHAEGVAVLLLNLFDAAELEPCAPDGGGVIETGPFVRFDLTFEVKPQLLVDLAIHGAGPKKRPQSEDDVCQHAPHPFHFDKSQSSRSLVEAQEETNRLLAPTV